MAEWIKGKVDKNGFKVYPECSSCGYHWIETVIGPVGKGLSNIVDAKYCPNCGNKMTKIIYINKESE